MFDPEKAVIFVVSTGAGGLVLGGSAVVIVDCLGLRIVLYVTSSVLPPVLPSIFMTGTETEEWESIVVFKIKICRLLMSLNKLIYNEIVFKFLFIQFNSINFI